MEEIVAKHKDVLNVRFRSEDQQSQFRGICRPQKRVIGSNELVKELVQMVAMNSARGLLLRPPSSRSLPKTLVGKPCQHDRKIVDGRFIGASTIDDPSRWMSLRRAGKDTIGYGRNKIPFVFKARSVNRRGYFFIHVIVTNDLT